MNCNGLISMSYDFFDPSSKKFVSVKNTRKQTDFGSTNNDEEALRFEVGP